MVGKDNNLSFRFQTWYGLDLHFQLGKIGRMRFLVCFNGAVANVIEIIQTKADIFSLFSSNM